jgi:hypothetical protein
MEGASMTSSEPELEIEQDITFQRREWAIQRVGWWVLAFFVVAAALGLFGNGPISHARAGGPGAPLWLEYERFVRASAPSRLTLHLGSPAASNVTQEIRINRPFFDGIRIERIIPVPMRVVLDTSHSTFVFGPEQLRNGGAVILDFQPSSAGLYTGVVASDASSELRFTQFSYF